MTGVSHVEIETKFDAPSDVTMPDFRGVSGVASVSEPTRIDLDADYFDTSDLRLLAAGIGLRRRRGGDDAGWHLKLHQPSGERLEVRRPLGDDPEHPPQELQDLVAAHVRRAPLGKIARLRTRRCTYCLLDATGETLAEVADDIVDAEPVSRPRASWREIEVELVGGDRGLLEELGRELRRAGATPSTATSKLSRALGEPGSNRPTPNRTHRSRTAGDVVAAYLAKQAATLVDLDPAVRLDADDAVHQMRVATRRLRSALATYRRLLDREVAERLSGELKWLGEMLGPVRDLEVIREHLAGLVDSEPRSLVIGPVRERIVSTLDRERNAARQRMVDGLTSARYLQLIDSLDHGAEAVNGKRARRPARKMLPVELRRTHRRMRRRLHAALSAEPRRDELFHEVRKAAKRVRYAADSASEALGTKAEKLAKRMEEGQEILGAHQDSVVSRDVLRRLATDAQRGGESSFTFGHLYALEERRAAESLAAFLERVDDGWAKPPGWLR
jgi:CHAD domain-containing protein